MKKIFLSILACILSLGILYGILFYFSFFQGDIYVKNGIVQGKAIKKDELNKYRGMEIKYEFDKAPITEISNLNITILDRVISKDIPILLQSQRYYLPISYIAKIFDLDNSNTILKNKNFSINFSSNNKWILNDKIYIPRGNLITYKGEQFLSISDIEFLFNLTAVFNSEKNSISLLKSPLNKISLKNDTLKDGKVALLRFEDVTAGGSFSNTEDQAKFKAIADYLYQNNFKFNVAWVPRYIHPENQINNDLLKENNLTNAGFINMLDYLINSNGQIGLHGYTHQNGETISTVGSELTNKDNSSKNETMTVIENGIFTASALNIPVKFFESPHYHATKEQKEIIGTYFQYQYEPYSLLNYIALKTTKHSNLFIPTPLSYVKDRNPEPLIKKIENPPSGFLASMFYHPSIEFEYITLKEKDYYFEAEFSNDSILKKIIAAFIDNNYTSIHATDFGN